jgi:dTDP-4-amino-4,6-dideoxygalactose transaminase
LATFKHRFVVPCMPDVSAYAPYLDEAHAAGVFSNFGPLAVRFEAAVLARYGGASEAAVTAANATVGLSAALIAAGVRGPVLVPGFTFPASLGAVRAANLEPVVVDVDAVTWATSADLIEQALDRPAGCRDSCRTGCEGGCRADAVMLVAPFGMRTDFSEAIRVCRARGLTVVIDNAAGLGIARQPLCGDPGVYEVFSLHATKTFAVGEGGVVVCHASKDAAVRGALNFALKTNGAPDGPFWGFNGKLSELHAAAVGSSTGTHCQGARPASCGSAMPLRPASRPM